MKKILQNETNMIVAAAVAGSVCLVLIDVLLDHMKHA